MNNIKDKITDYFIRENHIDLDEEYEIKSVMAADLICANRFDLMAKWIYIDSYEKGLDMDHAIKIYKDNINAFSCGKFIEPGTESKNSFEVYINRFNDLIDSIKNNGFNDEVSLIPVGANDVICDGSHRVTIAAYYGRKVTIIRFPKLVRNYDYRYFRRYLMNDINMGYMAMQYSHFVDGCYMACLWPVASRNKLDEVTDLIRNTGEIIYEQDIYLTYRGICNFMAHIYGHQSWTGSIDNHFSGVKGKAQCCYSDREPVHTYLFNANNLSEVLYLKNRIRGLFNLENHSIHISDNQYETEMMAELLYNPNTVEILNHAELFKYNMVFKRMEEIKNSVQANKLRLDRFIIDSSSVLEVCGLREAKDVDYLTDYDDSDVGIIGEGIDNHKSQIKYHSISIRDMLYNPENYFYFNGMKFLSIDRLIEMKNRRGESKDDKDIELLSEFKNKRRSIPRRFRYETIDGINQYLICNEMYGQGDINYEEYQRFRKEKYLSKCKMPLRVVKRILKSVKNAISLQSIARMYRRWLLRSKRKQLKNRDFSIIASNCNGGVLCNDLGIPFNSPFVNLFIKSNDFIKLCCELHEYMNEELEFVDEEDPIYGKVSYPTAYLRDIKIYFMHYADKEAAYDAWERRKKRINWDNLWILYTDRSGCTQEDLEAFDNLSYEHKVVFTHVAHPEIKSSFYIKGYENEEKVGILSEFTNARFPIKRMYEQFDFVRWLNDEG